MAAENKLIGKIFETGADELTGYAFSATKDKIVDGTRMHRLKKMYKETIKEVYARNKAREDVVLQKECQYEWDEVDKEIFEQCKKGIESLDERALSPMQTEEEFLEKTGWILERGLLECFENPQAVKEQIACAYLEKTKHEVAEHEKVAWMKTAREEEHKNNQDIMDELAKMQATIQATLAAIQDSNEIPQSNKVYRKMYLEGLFWDQEVPLSKVYIIPKTESEFDATKVVQDFFEQKKLWLLVLEGLPGSGKSSLLARLAEDYQNTDYLFLRLTNAVRGLCADLVDTLERVKGWEDYRREGRVLFLDGYDEVAGYLSLEILENFLWQMKEDGVKVVITTRPSYLNRLSFSESKKHILQHYDEGQISDWIAKYGEAKKMPLSEIEERKQELQQISERKDIVEVLGIPIILYMSQSMIYHKELGENISLSDITSTTQLYEKMFEKLKEGKHPNSKKTDLSVADALAISFGYYMQAKKLLRFSHEEKDGYNEFLASMGYRYEELNFDALAGNVFIKRISEGEDDREFYHKSIQDYFSAKYMYEEMEICYEAADYATLIDKHDVREEIVHLKYFINKLEESQKCELANRLQNMFLNCLTDQLYAQPERWFHRKDSDRTIEVGDVYTRVRLLFENHMQIMHGIFEMPIVERDVMYQSEVYPMMVSLARSYTRPSYVLEQEPEQFFWNTFKYGWLDTDNINRYYERRRVNELLTSSVLQENIELRGLEFKLFSEQETSITLDSCEWWKVTISNGGIYMLTMKGSTLEECFFSVNKCLYLEVSVCNFMYCTFYHVHSVNVSRSILKGCMLYQSEMLDGQVSRCNIMDGRVSDDQFQACKFENNMISDTEISNCIFHDCEIVKGRIIGECNITECRFKYVLFTGVENMENITFKDCTFINTEFVDCMGEPNFENCRFIKK